MKEEELLKKGFNAGYQIEKLDPELSKNLQNGFTESDHPYAKGFAAGSQEYINEKEIETPSLMSKYINKVDSRDASRTKDNDLDMEI